MSEEEREDSSAKPVALLITSLIACAGSIWYAIRHDKKGGLEDVIEILAWAKAVMWLAGIVIALYFILKDRADLKDTNDLK